MALQSSGAISFSDLQTEFGGSNPISMDEYYKDGGFTPSTVSTTGTASSMSFSESGGASGWPSPVFWRYYENGSGPIPTINTAGQFYIHSFWTDVGWTSGTSVCDVTMTLDQKGTYTVSEVGYNTGASRGTTVYVDGTQVASFGNGGSHTFTVDAPCTLRLYCTMNTIGNYNAHTIVVTGNGGARELTRTVNANIPTSGVIQLDDFYSGEATY